MSGGPSNLPRAGERTARIAVWGGLAVVLIAVVGAGAAKLIRRTTGPQTDGAAQRVAQPAFLEGGGVYGTVPDFTLTERSGRRVTRQDLSGRFWIADFIFTRCTGTCPILSARMTSLARALSTVDGAADLRFVSFSVDPEWDTPEVLDRYAASLGTVDPRWIFLTGPHEQLHRLIGEGFHLSVGEREPAEAAAGELITHSNRFVLVDPAGRIRGYYHGDDEASVMTLVSDLEKLRRGTAP